MMRLYIWPLGAVAFLIVYELMPEPVRSNPEFWIAPWVLSMVLFGLPHGALDHEVVLRLWKNHPRMPWGLLIVIGGYLFLTGLVIGGWFLAPGVIFIGFILLTLLHWGLADLWWSWKRDASYFSSFFHKVVFTFWRGALPMLVPLVSDPVSYRKVAESMCHLFEPHADFSWIQNPIVPSRVSVLLIVTFLLEFFLANRRARSANTNLAENLVLAVFFWTLPALVGIGFYFTFWHGLRHVLRLIKFESIIWPSFVIQAALPTLGAVLIMVILGATTNFQALASMDYLAVYLAVIAGLTVPHSLIVCWMDEKAGVWSTLKN